MMYTLYPCDLSSLHHPYFCYVTSPNDTYYQICTNTNKTTGAMCVAGSTYSSEATKITWFLVGVLLLMLFMLSFVYCCLSFDVFVCAMVFSIMHVFDCEFEYRFGVFHPRLYLLKITRFVYL